MDKFVLKQTGVENILILAIDAAKYTHKAMICNYYGDILVHDFEFDASLTGIEQVKEIVTREMKSHQMKKVVVGIETTGHYYEDLVRHLKNTDDYHVRIINAATTASERDTLLNWSKTDRLDLMVIVQAVIHGRGTSSKLPSGSINDLQKWTRARRELIKAQTALKNNILGHVDHIFREYQGKIIWNNGERKKQKPFYNMFAKASRFIMKHHLHPTDLLKLGTDGLRELSIQENLKLRDKTIETLIELAQHSVSLPKEALVAEQFLLNQKLDQFELIEDQIQKLEEEIEDVFLETDGAIILSIPGVGLISGAELYAEMGDLSDFDRAGQLIKMAGTNPIVKQSGLSRAIYYAISKQGRKPFRNATYQIGRAVAHNNPEMNEKYNALKARGKHTGQAYIALGNRVIRLAFSMIKKQTLYQTEHPDYVLHEQISRKLRQEHQQRFYEKFVL